MSPGRVLVVPTRRLAAVAAVAAVVAPAWPGAGLLVPLVALNAALLLVAAVDAAFAVDPTRLGAERDLPPVVVLGAVGEVGWTITNPTDRRARVWVADELAPSLRATSRRFDGVVPARGHLHATVDVRPRRRGRFEVGHLVVRVAGPLGLGARQRAIPQPAVLRVHPTFASRAEAELRIDRARVLEVGLRSAKGRGGGTEFDQLREYGVDDEVRRIDWAATARTGKAMVRTYRAERNQTVMLLLDNGRLMAGQVAGAPRVEHAMDAAMCLTTVATRLGDRCGLVAFDRAVRAVVPPRSGRAQLGRLTEALYDLHPALVESDHRTAFATVLARFPRRSLIVVFTDLVAEALDEGLLPALPRLLRHHLVVVAAVRDPEVATWAATPPADADDAYRATAAVASLARRDATAARLRGLGAVVVDAPAGQLAPRLADLYLDLKARGTL